MPFNAESYRLNLYRKSRDRLLAQARDIKARAQVGQAYQWEVDRIPRLVQMARLDNRLALSQRRIIAITRGSRPTAKRPRK